jgi:hypothetical protein
LISTSLSNKLKTKAEPYTLEIEGMESQITSQNKLFINTSNKQTEQICNFSWINYFPVTLENTQIDVIPCENQLAYEFITNQLAPLFHSNPDHRFFIETLNPNKLRFMQAFVDSFFFRNALGETVGVFLGNLSSWNTYYLRYCGLLPNYQGRHLYPKFIRYLIQVLSQFHIDKLETDISPSNLRSIRANTSLSFMTSGITLSENWGSLLRFTKYIAHENEKTFIRQFCQ